mmetsp:Transcript_6010/g.10450  ORF Transcript_6010/g.10450 Transcript_6010/m.10450 type:complete len:204 (-) Transcript_6010:344-955(-)
MASSSHHVNELDVVASAVLQGLVHLLVFLNACLEVTQGLFLTHAFIVWAVLHLVTVVLLQHFLIIANTFNEQVLVGAMELVHQIIPALVCGVGGIENGHLPRVGGQVRFEVRQRRFQRTLPRFQTVLVGLVKERGVLHHIGILLQAPVGAHVEEARVMAQPVEVAHHLVAQECLSASREADHDDDELIALHSLLPRVSWAALK